MLVDHTDNQLCSRCTDRQDSIINTAQGHSVPPLPLHCITLYTHGESRSPASTQLLRHWTHSPRFLPSHCIALHSTLMVNLSHQLEHTATQTLDTLPSVPSLPLHCITLYTHGESRSPASTQLLRHWTHSPQIHGRGLLHWASSCGLVSALACLVK